MALADLVNPTQISNMAPDLGNSYMQGQQFAVDLAQKRQQLQIQQVELQQRQQDAAVKKQEYFFNYLDRIQNLDSEDDVALKNEMLKNLPNVAQIATGEKIDADNPMIATLKNSPGYRQKILDAAKSLDQYAVEHPGQGYDIVAEKLKFGATLKSISGAKDINEVLTTSDKLFDDVSKIAQYKAAFGDKLTMETVKANVKLAMDAQGRPGVSPDDIAIVRNPQNAVKDPVNYSLAVDRITKAANESLAREKEAKIQAVELKPKQLEAQINAANSLQDYRKAMIDLAKQRANNAKDTLSIKWANLDERQKARKDRGIGRIEKDQLRNQYETSNLAAVKGLNILNQPNPNWVLFHEVVTDLASLLTVKPSAVVPVYARANLDPRLAQKDIDSVRTYLSGKYEGGPPPEMIGQLKESFGRLQKVFGVARALRTNRIINDNVRTGNFGLPEAKDVFQEWEPDYGGSAYSAPVGYGSKSGSSSGKIPQAANTATVKAIIQKFGGDKVKTKRFLDSKGVKYRSEDLQ